MREAAQDAGEHLRGGGGERPLQRFVLVGLATPRAAWFRTLAQWATAGTIPVDFVKCVSEEELRAHLGSERPFSAALVDASLAGLDRDLVAAAAAVGCPVLVVGSRSGASAVDVACAGVLSEPLSPEDVMKALRSLARPVLGHDLELGPPRRSASPVPAGRLVACVGTGGTGASMAAAAVAQGLAGSRASVVLADFARRAEQAMLHDARDLFPSLQELAEAHRAARPDAELVRSMTTLIVERGYSLLLGLRRPTAWSTIRPRAFAAMLEGLLGAFSVVVADIDRDLEGEQEGGSLDVEERNTMARETAARADVVVAVGRPGLKGVHALVSLVYDLIAFGVAPERLLPVVTCAPRSRRARSEVARTFSDLVRLPDRGHAGGSHTVGPLFVPERPLERAVRDASQLPEAIVRPLSEAVGALLRTCTPSRPQAGLEPRLVRPGSLGHWASEEQAGARGGQS